jgi:hypothetical protein
VNGDYEEFWWGLPEQAQHPLRVPIVEALRWVREPLSAITLVDVLDGTMTMWETSYHLRVLEALKVAEVVPAETSERTKRDLFNTPYRLRDWYAIDDD